MLVVVLLLEILDSKSMRRVSQVLLSSCKRRRVARESRERNSLELTGIDVESLEILSIHCSDENRESVDEQRMWMMDAAFADGRRVLKRRWKGDISAGGER